MRNATLSVAFFLANLVCAGAALAGTATLSGNDLLFTANPGEVNHTLVLEEGLGFDVFDSTAPVTAGQGCAVVNANQAFCAKPNKKKKKMQIRIVAGDMDDVLTLRAFTYRRARLEGDAGSDELKGGDGLNFLDGGLGADIFRGRRQTFLNVNHDVVDYSSRVAPVTVTLADGTANEGEAGENDRIDDRVDEIDGGHARDTMSDDNRRFVLFYGKQGNDRLTGGLDYGGAGDDRLVCPRGLCELHGGGRDDVLRGAGSGDDMEGGSGDDKLVGRAGGDLMWGNAGIDIIRAGRSNDFVNGGSEADLIFGGKGRDRLLGTSGPDTIFARDGERDNVNGGPGSDRARVDLTLDRLKRVEMLLA